MNPQRIHHPKRLHFGVPSIDELIGPCAERLVGEFKAGEIKFGGVDRRTEERGQRFWRYGLHLPDRPMRNENFEILELPGGIQLDSEGPIASSVNILGGDGSGKSILALHMAGAYANDLVLAGQNQAKIIYASSDLNFERAKSTWDVFRLGDPRKRHVPFEGPGWSEDMWTPYRSREWVEWDARKGAWAEGVPIREIQPRSKNFHEKLLDPWEIGMQELLFVDLASTTAGDDWGLLNKIIGLLKPLDDSGGEWPHMLVIDAVEGLETIVGQVDSYGMQSTRRSRIAQLMQLAAGKCHLVLVNELRNDWERLDEEFVTDLVVKLQIRERDLYSHRTIEVVKARSQPIMRGEHVLTIRGKEAGCLHGEVWPDVPETDNAYLRCFHSLDARDRKLANASPDSKGAPRPFFGISYLDDISIMRRGKLTAIIGDEATHKAKLVRAFVANAFAKGGGRELSDRKDWDFVIYLT